MTTITRYRQLCEQRAYRRRVAAFGLPALLAPYRMVAPFIPAQRQPSEDRATVKR
jgi:hypothetical protein